MESSGLIHTLTLNLMQKVRDEAGPSIGRRSDLRIAFNFAGKLFSEPTIVKDVRNIFANSPIEFSQVVLEVTERDPIVNFTKTRQTIAALQGLGVRIAIDDVGTGHSGLSYMLKLGVDIIKIEKIFVDAIGTDRNSTTIVETLVDLARNMRMDVGAEGVENFEQVMHLRTLGVRLAQGYVFAPPLREARSCSSSKPSILPDRGCGRDRAYRGVGLKHCRNEKGRPCGRPVKTPRGRNLVRVGCKIRRPT